VKQGRKKKDIHSLEGEEAIRGRETIEISKEEERGGLFLSREKRE